MNDSRAFILLLGFLALIAVLALIGSFLYNVSKIRENTQRIIELLAKNEEDAEGTDLHCDIAKMREDRQKLKEK